MNYPAIRIGDLLARPKCLSFIDHVGVAVGRDAVLHNTPEKGEHVATVQEFSAGERVRVRPTSANPLGVMARCKQILAGPKKYDLVQRNCEHTVYEVLGGEAKSPQLILAIIAAIALVWLLMRRG